MEASDAIDLASTYNRLGLALRDSGKYDMATKEAFLAGLEASPQDFTLLVNGGVAHQVHILMILVAAVTFIATVCFAMSFWFEMFFQCGIRALRSLVFAAFSPGVLARIPFAFGVHGGVVLLVG